MLKGAVALTTSLLVSLSVYASLVVISRGGNTVPSAPYLKNIQVPKEAQIQKSIQDQLYKLKGHHISEEHMLYPSKSDFSLGWVVKHKLDDKHFSSVPVFIIGADKKSLKWALKNSVYLKNIHAFGVITNVQSDAQTKQIELKTGLHLIPASLRGLSNIIHTNHYPVLIYKGWVLQ